MIALLLVQAALGATLIVGQDGPTVQATLDAAAPGDRVVLPTGDWPGPAVIRTALTLGSEGGVLVGGDTGDALRIQAAGAVVDGLQVRHSGRDLATSDSCIRLGPQATGAVVRRSTVTDCLFGIYVDQAAQARIEDNQVQGIVGENPSRKGNGVHLFDGTGLVVRGNTITDARDGVYVSATEDSLIADNVASHLRYGIHYMYSYDNTIRGNRISACTGGIALMESKRLVVEDNESTDNVKQGILFRDVQYSRIAGNRVLRNGEGLFFFSALDDEIVDNVIAGNQIGARIWAGTERNIVRGNSFIGNAQQVYYVASADQRWEGESGGNYWSDYLGWDQDGDGHGDRPYQVDSLVSGLLYQTPAAVLLLNSPTLEILSHLQRQLPALRVPTIIDLSPLISAPPHPGPRP